MTSYRKRILAVVAAGSLGVTLAACGGGSGGSSGSASDAQKSARDVGAKGGTLTYFTDKPLDHTDPQRLYTGRDLTNFRRTVYRSLVAFPISDNPDVANKPVADLATDTGTSSNNAKTWKFTIKDGVKWQDGKAISCADFKYGASRVYAQDVITGGPGYLINYLNVPVSAKGVPAYNGPYKKKGQAIFDKAITCSGNTITYNFRKSWPDFPLAIASLSMMDPYRQDKDQGDRSNYQIFSNGPYKLQGSWNKNSGGTLVRNDNYDASTDSKKVRMALPDSIKFNIGQTTEVINQRLIANSGADQAAVTDRSIPPAFFSQITGPVADRSATEQSPFVFYLQPNFERLKNAKVRQALAEATDVTSWITSAGGKKSFTAADSVVNPAVSGYQPNPSFKDRKLGGDVAKAKKLLESSGVSMPYPIKYTYNQTDTADKQSAALKRKWDAAGFDTTLDPLGADAYYSTIQKPNNTSDVVNGGWGADWPSEITVTPPLFDGRQITAASSQNDYGLYNSKEFNALVDKAQTASSLSDQTTTLQKADAVLGKDTAYIPLGIQTFYLMRGSKVTGYQLNPSSSAFPDLGPIGVNGK